MKNILIALILVITMDYANSQSFYELSIGSIDNISIKMSDFKGKYVMIVNVASYCGYTSQYSELKKLSDQYQDKLIVIGVPCNQFGSQEPGNSKDIKAFCESNFDVTFPLTEKVKVKGKSIHPLYEWLTEKSKNGIGNFSVSWNFNKFLIDPEGQLIGHFKSNVKPMDKEIITKLN